MFLKKYFDFSGFSSRKCKPGLVQSIIRMDLVRNKKSIEIKKKKYVVANHLAEDSIEKARLEAEQIVRLDFFVEALDILELMCTMLRDNVKLIELSKDQKCSQDLLEPITTVLYCCDRVDVPELRQVKKQLVKKFGEKFLEVHMAYVNDKLKTRLSGQRPNAYIVLEYMKEIAKEKEVAWEPDAKTENVGQRTDTAMTGPSGEFVRTGTASGLGLAAYEVTDGTLTPAGVNLNANANSPKVNAHLPRTDTSRASNINISNIPKAIPYTGNMNNPITPPTPVLPDETTERDEDKRDSDSKSDDENDNNQKPENIDSLKQRFDRLQQM